MFLIAERVSVVCLEDTVVHLIWWHYRLFAFQSLPWALYHRSGSKPSEKHTSLLEAAKSLESSF